MSDHFGTLILWAQQGLILLHFTLVITFAVRVILQRLPVGASLAWLLVLALLPYLGVGLYLLFGERFLGVKHRQRRVRLRQLLNLPMLREANMVEHAWNEFHPASRALATLEYQAIGIPALGGNDVEFLQTAQATIEQLCRDIHAAESTCHLEFYIWHPGGIADNVADALLTAAERGVYCRILLDAVGSNTFFNSPLAAHLTHPNIELVKACPIGIIPASLARYDLRSHRKTVIIDNRIAYVGSFNLVDPSQFKQSAAVGEWIDVMARIQGPLVQVFNGVFLWYWNIETGQTLPLLPQPVSIEHDKTVAQVAPSGPDNADHSILKSLLQAIFSATRSIDIVTPYFVPGETLEMALSLAAQRGVRVNLILPARVDSFLVRYASRSYFSSLMAAGVNILQFEQGLLHTKCVIIDDQLAFFGTVNMDQRSLWLNFEMTVIIYDQPTVAKLVEIVAGYRRQTLPLDQAEWQKRSRFSLLLENIMHLMSPLI